MFFLFQRCRATACSEFTRPTIYLPGPAAAAAIALLFGLVSINLRLLGFSVSNIETALFLVGASAVGVVYGWFRDIDPRLVSALSAFATLLVTTVLSALLQYTSTALGAERLEDHSLLAVDRILGLDPISFIAFCDRSAFMCRILQLAYMSMGAQLIVLMALFVIGRDHRGADAFVVSLVVLIIVGSAIAAAVPAIGFTGIVDVSFQNTAVEGGRTPQPTILAVRSGALREIDLSALNGLITFPSGHAAVAVLAILAARRVRCAFWPFASLNGLMLVSTITHGGHYFCDLLVGGALAMASWPIATKLAAGRPSLWSVDLPGRRDLRGIPTVGGETPRAADRP
jgi:membrane-associated phospholipid phosphatase